MNDESQKPVNNNYRDGWEAIWGKKPKPVEETQDPYHGPLFCPVCNKLLGGTLCQKAHS